MTNEEITKWINEIIQDITNVEVSLENILRKTTVLAFKVKNERLKKWVKYETDGYDSTLNVPDYRVVGAEVMGNLVQQNFGSIIQRPNMRIPIEILPQDDAKNFRTVKFYQPISVIESFLSGDQNNIITINLTNYQIQFLNHGINSNYTVESAWKEIPRNQIRGLLSNIKNKLLTFLLELNDEIGNYENLTIMKDKNIVEKLFDKNITSNSLNISIGDNNTINSSYIENQNIELESSLKSDLEEIIKVFKDIQKNIDSDDYAKEVETIELEVKKKSPAKSILTGSLSTIKTMLLNIASNASTDTVVKSIERLIEKLGQ